MSRLKASAVSTVMVARSVLAQRGIVRGEMIELTKGGAVVKCPYPLPRVEATVFETGEPVVFLTHHLAFGATPIVTIYRDR